MNSLLVKTKLNMIYIFKSGTFAVFFLILFVFSLFNITGEYGKLTDRYDNLASGITSEELKEKVDPLSDNYDPDIYESYKSFYEDYKQIDSDRSIERSIETTGYNMSYFLLMIFAVVCIGNDYHYKTINVFASKNWGVDIIAKGIATFIHALIMFIGCTFLLTLMNSALDKLYMDGIPILNNVVIASDFNLPLTIGTIVLSFMFIVAITLTIVTIIKNRQYSLIATLIYVVVPSLGIYDFRRFNFALTNSVKVGFNVDAVVYLIVFVMCIAFVGLAYLIANKTNKYVG